jgi:hypothetical protein
MAKFQKEEPLATPDLPRDPRLVESSLFHQTLDQPGFCSDMLGKINDILSRFTGKAHEHEV